MLREDYLEALKLAERGIGKGKKVIVSHGWLVPGWEVGTWSFLDPNGEPLGPDLFWQNLRNVLVSIFKKDAYVSLDRGMAPW